MKLVGDHPSKWKMHLTLTIVEFTQLDPAQKHYFPFMHSWKMLLLQWGENPSYILQKLQGFNSFPEYSLAWFKRCRNSHLQTKTNKAPTNKQRICYLRFIRILGNHSVVFCSYYFLVHPSHDVTSNSFPRQQINMASDYYLYYYFFVIFIGFNRTVSQNEELHLLFLLGWVITESSTSDAIPVIYNVHTSDPLNTEEIKEETNPSQRTPNLFNPASGWKIHIFVFLLLLQTVYLLFLHISHLFNVSNFILKYFFHMFLQIPLFCLLTWAYF